MPSWRLDFRSSEGKNETPPPPLKLQNLNSQKWANVVFEINIISSHPTSVPSFSQSVDHNFWSLEHFLREWHIRLHLNNINRHSGIEIPEAWMPTIRPHNIRPLPQRTAEGSVFSSHNASNTWIETHQPWARFVIHQSLTATLVQIHVVRLSKSTLSPYEDLQCAVASRPISKWQSWDKR